MTIHIARFSCIGNDTVVSVDALADCINLTDSNAIHSALDKAGCELIDKYKTHGLVPSPFAGSVELLPVNGLDGVTIVIARKPHEAGLEASWRSRVSAGASLFTIHRSDGNELMRWPEAGICIYHTKTFVEAMIEAGEEILLDITTQNERLTGA